MALGGRLEGLRRGKRVCGVGSYKGELMQTKSGHFIRSMASWRYWDSNRGVDAGPDVSEHCSVLVWITFYDMYHVFLHRLKHGIFFAELFSRKFSECCVRNKEIYLKTSENRLSRVHFLQDCPLECDHVPVGWFYQSLAMSESGQEVMMFIRSSANILRLWGSPAGQRYQ